MIKYLLLFVVKIAVLTATIVSYINGLYVKQCYDRRPGFTSFSEYSNGVNTLNYEGGGPILTKENYNNATGNVYDFDEIASNPVDILSRRFGSYFLKITLEVRMKDHFFNGTIYPVYSLITLRKVKENYIKVNCTKWPQNDYGFNTYYFDEESGLPYKLNGQNNGRKTFYSFNYCKIQVNQETCAMKQSNQNLLLTSAFWAIVLITSLNFVAILFKGNLRVLWKMFIDLLDLDPDNVIEFCNPIDGSFSLLLKSREYIGVSNNPSHGRILGGCGLKLKSFNNDRVLMSISQTDEKSWTFNLVNKRSRSGGFRCHVVSPNRAELLMELLYYINRDKSYWPCSKGHYLSLNDFYDRFVLADEGLELRMVESNMKLITGVPLVDFIKENFGISNRLTCILLEHNKRFFGKVSIAPMFLCLERKGKWFQRPKFIKRSQWARYCDDFDIIMSGITQWYLNRKAKPTAALDEALKYYRTDCPPDLIDEKDIDAITHFASVKALKETVKLGSNIEQQANDSGINESSIQDGIINSFIIESDKIRSEIINQYDLFFKKLGIEFSPQTNEELGPDELILASFESNFKKIEEMCERIEFLDSQIENHRSSDSKLFTRRKIEIAKSEIKSITQGSKGVGQGVGDSDKKVFKLQKLINSQISNYGSKEYIDWVAKDELMSAESLVLKTVLCEAYGLVSGKEYRLSSFSGRSFCKNIEESLISLKTQTYNKSKLESLSKRSDESKMEFVNYITDDNYKKLMLENKRKYNEIVKNDSKYTGESQVKPKKEDIEKCILYSLFKSSIQGYKPPKQHGKIGNVAKTVNLISPISVEERQNEFSKLTKLKHKGRRSKSVLVTKSFIFTENMFEPLFKDQTESETDNNNQEAPKEEVEDKYARRQRLKEERKLKGKAKGGKKDTKKISEGGYTVIDNFRYSNASGDSIKVFSINSPKITFKLRRKSKVAEFDPQSQVSAKHSFKFLECTDKLKKVEKIKSVFEDLNKGSIKAELFNLQNILPPRSRQEKTRQRNENAIKLKRLQNRDFYLGYLKCSVYPTPIHKVISTLEQFGEGDPECALNNKLFL